MWPWLFRDVDKGLIRAQRGRCDLVAFLHSCLRTVMIIACPACATRYVVPDSAIGMEGRTVRCAKCRHSWFQEGPEITPPPAAVQPLSPEPGLSDDPIAQEAAPRPAFSENLGSSQDQWATAATQEEVTNPVDAIADTVPEADDAVTAPPSFAARPLGEDVDAAPPVSADYDEDYSHFDHEPPFRPRRNRLKMLTIAAAIFAASALGLVAAASYWGLPDWVPISRPTFAQAQPDLVLDFPAERQDRRTLPNGTEFFGASGTVTNVGKSAHNVPSILIVLRDARDRIVYSWEVTPPKRSLAPGESVTINEAVTDVPRSAKFAEIGWKPE